MPVKLAQPKVLSVNVSNMKDGQIAEIVGAPALHQDKLGRIVQRYKDNLITVGQPSGFGWTDFFERKEGRFEVRILEAGEKIVIQ